MEALVVSAADVNHEHEQAQGLAKDAIKHAIRCGEMLIEKKKGLNHGGFMSWIDANCKFEYSTAARYMKAAQQNSTGVEVLTLSQVFASGRRARSHVAALLEESPPVNRSNDGDIADMIRRLAERCRSATQEDIRDGIAELQRLLDELSRGLSNDA